MDFESQLLFFFSAIGAFNGFFLSIYFAFLVNNRSRTTYFLAALLFVVSVRVAKSVFLTFYAGISSSFIQVGLTACLLIGPFLYLYTRSAAGIKDKRPWLWLLHVLPIIVAMIYIGYYYPYKEYRYLWQRRAGGILGFFLFTQWFTYIVLSAIILKPSFKRLFSKKENISSTDFWSISILLGIFFIYLAYLSNGYTSYIVGALSFSFTFYILIVIWVFKRKDYALLPDTPQTKYQNKKIDGSTAQEIQKKLESLLTGKEFYKDPNLKLSQLADQIGISSHQLSQYLNDNLGKSFATFINEYRIEAATQMIQENSILTLEAIGNECGFKSNSTFYAAFKKVHQTTPAKFMKELEKKS